ncbi:CU044_2847 family protein [Streptomyces sp. NPDC003374]
MDSQVVSYEVDPQTTVQFEIDPVDGFSPVSSDDLAGRVRDAVQPAVEGARAVIDRIAELRPAELQLKFGIKVNGSANWLIAKAATEANFEVTMTWRPEAPSGEGSATG